MASKIWFYLELAANMATKGNERHYRLGAVAIRKDGAVVISNNSRIHKPNHNHGHAENRVMRKAGCGAIIFVSRIDKNGSYRMARPCPKCLVELRNRRAKKVFYTISDHEYGSLEFA